MTTSASGNSSPTLLMGTHLRAAAAQRRHRCGSSVRPLHSQLRWRAGGALQGGTAAGCLQQPWLQALPAALAEAAVQHRAQPSSNMRRAQPLCS